MTAPPRVLRVVAISPVEGQPGTRRFFLRTPEPALPTATYMADDPDGSVPWVLGERVLITGVGIGT